MRTVWRTIDRYGGGLIVCANLLKKQRRDRCGRCKRNFASMTSSAGVVPPREDLPFGQFKLSDCGDKRPRLCR
jgi:hypothetical protein